MSEYEYLTTEDVAVLCRTTPATVRQWRYHRTGPAGARVGKRVLYKRSDVVAWLEVRKQASAA
jgi:hypothetical protein